MTALSGTLVILALLVVPYVRPWIQQQSELADGRAQVSDLQKQVADLQAEKNRWKDPAYVRAQARQRLHYVLPGEVGYVVLDDKQTVTKPADPRQAAAAVPQDVPGGSTSAWYAKLWQSIQLAGDPGTAQQVDGAAVPGAPRQGDAGLVAPGPSVSVAPPAPTATGRPGTPRPSTSTRPSATTPARPTVKVSPSPTPTR